MKETEQQRKEREHEEDLLRLREFRPIDDNFMRCLFKDNVPLAEFVLRIITGKKDLIITSCPRRARYHSSVMDIENLDAGQEFKELPETYTIFITEKDFYEKGEPLYIIERMNLTTGKNFEDGEHILYVNGEYRGDSDLGKLMHDFNCVDAKDMNFALMAERTRYLKENPKGVDEMCKSMEDMRNEVAERTAENTLLQTIKSLMETTKWSAERAMDALKIPDDDKAKYLSRL